jgi:gliding motility-associated-like protein
MVRSKFIFRCIIFLSLWSLTGKAQVTGIKIIGDTCTSLTLNLQATGTSSSPYFFWNFGDPRSGVNDTITIFGGSANPFPTHTFTSAGPYNVCVTFTEPGSSDSTICRRILLGLCCEGNIQANDSCLQNNISFTLLSGAVINSVNWNFDDPASGVNNVSTLISPSHTFSRPGLFNVTANVSATCGNFQVPYQINVVNCSNNCTGEILSLDSCIQNSIPFQIISDSSISSVSWDFDDPLSGISNTSTLLNPSHVFSSKRTYNIKAIVRFSCGIDTLEKSLTLFSCDSATEDCSIVVPNIFTPNGDTLNDFFAPVSQCTFEQYGFFVYNRWGQEIFKTDKPSDRWDGKFNNEVCIDGNYYFLVRYKRPSQEIKHIYGSVTLLR